MRIAFVLPRYGSDFIGGAERLGRGLAEEAAAHGWEVEVWTTCAIDLTSWENRLSPGSTVENGVTVKRFVVDRWDQSEYHRLHHQYIYEAGLPERQQYEWFNSGPHSSALNAHVKSEAANFDAIIIMPYLANTSLDAAMMAGRNVVLWPCLHSEPYAHMEPIRLLLETAYGVVFISPEEARFAYDDLKVNIDRSTVIGSGVQISAEYTGENLQERAKPYLLYVGRLEHGKNVHMLYEFVRRYVVEGRDIQLVVAGDGPCPPPSQPEIDFVGKVAEVEKRELLANALAVCQPSYNESFSLVIMESWLVDRPALVWSGCDVTRGHVQRSKGGLWFGNYAEFEAAVDWFQQHPEAADRMGRNGHQYVTSNFEWRSVFTRFRHVLADWKEADKITDED